MRLNNKRECLFFLLFFFLIFGIFQYNIHRLYGMIYYPDEFGYWANAASWNGYDWSSLTALNSYYSFGYSLLLAPIMRVFTDGVTAYRAAVGLNMLLQAAAMFPLYGIARRLFPRAKGHHDFCAVGIGLFYPVWIFFEQTTLTEGLLHFLYILIVYLMVCVMEHARMGTILLLIGMLGYLCFVHMRTVGVAIAACLVLLCRLWSQPANRKKMFLAFGVLAVGILIGAGVRLVVLRSVYANTDQEMLARTDVSGQFARVLAVCSREGIVRFLCGCAGKLFYLGASSFGLVYYALAYAGINSRALVHKMRRRMTVTAAEWVSLFLLLSFTGQFLVTAVYMNNPRRIDEVVYGRYNDYLLPVFLTVGFLVMYQCICYGKCAACVVGMQSALFPVVLYGEQLYGGSEVQGYFMAGIGYLVDDLHFDVIPDMAAVCLLSNLLIFMLSLGVWIGRKKNMPVPLMAAVILTEIMMGTWLNHKYTYQFNDLVYTELKICDRIEQGETDVPVTYLYGGGVTYIDTIQFQLPDREIRVVDEEDFEEGIGLEGYLILDLESACREQVESYVEPCAESACFVLYDLRK